MDGMISFIDYVVLEKEIVWFLNQYPSFHSFIYQQTPILDQTPFWELGYSDQSNRVNS